MNISKDTKILIGVLVIIITIIAVGGWLIFESKEKKIGVRIEIKGKLETIQPAPSSLFNKECLDRDLKVGSYYLIGLCKKPHLAASLLEVIGEEIEVKGEAKEINLDVPSEEDPEILITKTFEVIEVEEIVPPEIIRIITNTTVYEPEEKITIHLKHYLKKSVFSYFNTENPICGIRSIEKKNGTWEPIALAWAKPPDCAQISLKEIKPYHSSGEFGMFEWQSPKLDSGEYRLKIIYKLAEEEEWKEVYSNKFAILGQKISKPATETKCEVKRGYQDYRDPRQKAAVLEIGFNSYTNFFLKKMTIEYERIVRFGSLQPPLITEENTQGYRPFILKIKAKDGSLLSAYNDNEIRPQIMLYRELHLAQATPVPPLELCPDCPPLPPPEFAFAKEGEFSLWIPLAPFVPEKGVGEIKSIKSIEISEKEKLPDWAIKEGKALPGYKPNELLLKIDLSECLEKFCGEMAYQDDPYCVGEYPLPPIVKGKVTDPQGNPVEKVEINILWAPLGEPITWKSAIVDTLYTDKNGKYLLDTFHPRYEDESGLKEGTYSLSFRPHTWFKPNLKPLFEQRINLKKGEIKTFDITLKQCGSIGGKITDKDGNPITDAAVYEIGFETPRHAVCEEVRQKEGLCKLSEFIIPYLEPGNYKIGAYVKIGDKYIDLPPKEVKVEFGKTAIVNFLFEK